MVRKRIPKRVKHAVAALQGGLCGCGCGGQLTPDCELEHGLAVALGGGNEVENLRWWNKACHKPKTAADIRRIRKADRQRKAFQGTKKRKGRKLQSRGFQGWQNFKGEAVKRKDPEPIS